MLGLHFCARAFSSCGKRGPLFITVRGPLTIVASLVVEHRLQMRRLSSCGSRTQLLHGMWDLPRPGLEPVSSALAGRFSTTVPPGKPLYVSYLILNILHQNTLLPQMSRGHEFLFCLVLWKLLILLKSYCPTQFIILNSSLLLFFFFSLKSPPSLDTHFILPMVRCCTKVIKSILVLESDVSGS